MKTNTYKQTQDNDEDVITAAYNDNIVVSIHTPKKYVAHKKQVKRSNK